MKHFKHRASGHTATYDNGVFTLNGIPYNVAAEPDPEIWEEVKPEKPKVPTWEDFMGISGAYVDKNSQIITVQGCIVEQGNRNIYPTKHHAEAALAEAQLLQLRDSKFYRNGWKPDWRNGNCKYAIVSRSGKLVVDFMLKNARLFCFQDKETTQRFLDEQRELLEIWAKKFD